MVAGVSLLEEILKKEELLKCYDGKYVEGLILINGYSEQPTKNGSSYLSGNLQAKGDMSFKVWQGECFNTMKETDLRGQICHVSASVNEYNGVISLILTKINKVYSSGELREAELKKSDFMVSKYDADGYWSTLVNSVKSKVSESAFKAFELIMEDIEERFKEEYAAINHHDNCFHGLLAHTTKVVKCASLISMYPEILKHVGKDELFIGCAIHDIGKVFEYSDGSISNIGKVISHNTIGCLMLEKKKDKIIELKGQDFYNSLLSVIAQHHGEYGERPRTVLAYVVNQLDCLDAILTSINEKVETAGDSPQIAFDGLKLS